jgi:hypothetical protein
MQSLPHGRGLNEVSESATSRLNTLTRMGQSPFAGITHTEEAFSVELDRGFFAGRILRVRENIPVLQATGAPGATVVQRAYGPIQVAT